MESAIAQEVRVATLFRFMESAEVAPLGGDFLSTDLALATAGKVLETIEETTPGGHKTGGLFDRRAVGIWKRKSTV